MAEVKAIETFYNGYRFRSRLEARWAVFFDNAFIEYQYEPEGFVLPDGSCYLPDFYLPLFHMYVEIKQNDISDCDFDIAKIKLEQLFSGDEYKKEGKGISVALFRGEPMDDFMIAYCNYKKNGETGSNWNLIKFMRGVYVKFKDKRYKLKKSETVIAVYGNDKDKLYSTSAFDGNSRFVNESEIEYYLSSFKNAKLRARQARFEYGERG